MSKTISRVLFVLVALSLLVTPASFAGDTMVAHVSETHCNTKHADASEGSIKCVKRCVDGGSTPLLVSEDGEVIEVKNPDKLKGHLGHQVKVTLSADKTVESIEHMAP